VDPDAAELRRLARGTDLTDATYASVYSEADTARRVAESDKRAQLPGSPVRSPFERDRARVLHSHAFRRLADKTQVVTPGEDDFPRTRLTHSLEVAQIARELGGALGCDPDVTDAAGLAHDLGHPPFGHNGEEALDLVATGIGGFEGNAQTLRILTRLEPKVIDGSGASAGLNLTRAVLDATVKYPWPRPPGGGKFGVYAEDRAAYDWVRAGVPDGRRCLEAQVMDWADDVAYSVHDLEDGVHAGLIRIGTFDAAARADLVEVAASLYTDQGPGELAGVLDVLLELPSLRDLAGYDRSFASLAAAKRVTSELTGRFVGAAVAATRSAQGNDKLVRYAADLAVPAPVAAECALLKAMAARYVMFRPEAKERRKEQIRLLLELSEQLATRAPAGLDPAAGQAWCEARDDTGRLRAVIDQVARLTDRAAVAWHRALDN
jgi:dGTPase